MGKELRNVRAITMFVEDLEGSRRFYQDVFSLTPVHVDESSTAFNFGNTIVNLVTIPGAQELIDPGIVAGPEAGSRFVLTIQVEDVDAVQKELEEKGVTLLNGPLDRPWGIRTLSFRDPAGHIWEVAQDLPTGGAS